MKWNVNESRNHDVKCNKQFIEETRKDVKCEKSEFQVISKPKN